MLWGLKCCSLYLACPPPPREPACPPRCPSRNPSLSLPGIMAALHPCPHAQRTMSNTVPGAPCCTYSLECVSCSLVQGFLGQNVPTCLSVSQWLRAALQLVPSLSMGSALRSGHLPSSPAQPQQGNPTAGRLLTPSTHVAHRHVNSQTLIK